MSYRDVEVTPFVGVWIETILQAATLKGWQVTPFVGVWIETRCRPSMPKPPPVTPFVGVWIETANKGLIGHALGGHTLRGCVD